MKIRPKLLIDTNPLEDEELAEKIFEETDKYSITPTTFKARNLKLTSKYENILSRTKIDIQKTEEKISLIDKEINQIRASLSVLKEYGILSDGELKGCEIQIKAPLFDLLVSKHSELTKQLNTLIHYNQSTSIIAEQKLILTYEDDYSNTQGQLITRHGINLTKGLSDIVKEYNSGLESLNPKIALEDQSVSSSKKKGAKSNQSNKEDQVNITLHPLEVINLENAINDLNSKGINKTVLVDIFARDQLTGLVKWQDNSLPETHTVVLFKNSEKQFIIIDPSNSSFSKHLSTNTKLISDELEILTLQKELRIYEQDKQVGTGPSASQYRDCIDIAVKLAFGLNKIQELDINKIEQTITVQEVTNQKEINENIVLAKEVITRIRQGSDSDIREKFNKFSTYINKQLKSFSIYPKEGSIKLSESLQEKYIEELIKISDLENNQYHSGIDVLGELSKSNDLTFKEFIGE